MPFYRFLVQGVDEEVADEARGFFTTRHASGPTQEFAARKVLDRLVREFATGASAHLWQSSAPKLQIEQGYKISWPQLFSAPNKGSTFYDQRPEADWRPFRRGSTFGRRGSERGVIVLDHEHGAGARISLERTRATTWAITCGLYGAMMHTRFFESEADARRSYVAMRSRLGDLTNLESEAEVEREVRRFLAEFP